MFVSMLAASLLMAQAAPAAAKADAAADKDPVVCKNEAAPGSRLPKKVCATKSEWERRKQEDRDNLERSQRVRPMIGQ
jgi:uncharacterized protein (DUF2147 family)